MRDEADGFDPNGKAVRPKPAGAVILTRASQVGTPEFLMMQRPETHRFGPGQWVFPGGKVETTDGPEEDPVAAARSAAIRETREELGISVDRDSTTLFLRWITPRGVPIRFDARFFLAVIREPLQVSPAKDEVTDWRWTTAHDAIEAFTANRMPMMFPTVKTMELLCRFDDLDALQAFARRCTAPPIEPAIRQTNDGIAIELPEGWPGFLTEGCAGCP